MSLPSKSGFPRRYLLSRRPGEEAASSVRVVLPPACNSFSNYFYPNSICDSALEESFKSLHDQVISIHARTLLDRPWSSERRTRCFHKGFCCSGETGSLCHLAHPPHEPSCSHRPGQARSTEYPVSCLPDMHPRWFLQELFRREQDHNPMPFLVRIDPAHRAGSLREQKRSSSLFHPRTSDG